MKMKGILALAALSCAACAHAAATRMATEDWVRRQLAGIGVRVLDVAVTTNGNGSVSYKSPFRSELNPRAKSVRLTFGPFSVAAAASPARAARRAASPVAALAASVEGTSVSAEVAEIQIDTGDVDALGNPVYKTFGPETIRTDGLPEKPGERHVHVIGADCWCVDHGRNASNITVPDVYADYGYDQVSDFGSWIDTGSWPYKVKTPKGTTYYYVDDPTGEGGELVPTWNEIALTDAWEAAMRDALDAINEHMGECRRRYVKSHTCDATEKAHQGDPETFDCGQYHAETCRTCGDTVAGERRHDYSGSAWGTVNDSEHRRYCAGRHESQTAPHAKQSGGSSKTYVRNADGGIVGWTTAPDVCADGCGWFRPGLSHSCSHAGCGPCGAGDGCTLPCPSCDGRHRIEAAGAGRCQRCSCDGCGRTEHALTGERTRARHTGWRCCGQLSDADCDRSNGVHCECECGDYSHGNGTPHDREDRASTSYQQVLAGESAYSQHDLRHWAIDKTDCAFCGDRYGNLEAHALSEESGAAVEYVYRDGETHVRRVSCAMGCGYTREDEDVRHTKDGDALAHENVSASVCRGWYRCPADGGCGGLWPEAGAHVKSTAAEDGCRCAKCRDYQFPHAYAADACGNLSCSVCGAVDPSAPESHPTCAASGDGHACACGKRTGDHVWGAFSQKSASAAGVVLEATCVASQWGAGGCGAKKEVTLPAPPETCAGDVHVPAASGGGCGCQCGAYGPSSPNPDEAFHAWGAGDCFCNCGRWHHAQGGNACPLVCGACRSHAATDGMDPAEVTAANATAYHVPFGSGDAISRCGCRCGANGPELDDPAYHYRMPNSCRCYGSGSGGSYHFRRPDPNCPGVCRHRDGYCHKVAASEKEKAAALVPATVEDHAKAESRICACACGEWGEGGRPVQPECFLHQWADGSCGCHCRANAERPVSDDAALHGYSGGSCTCDCGKMHRCPFADAGCTKVCGGACGGAYRAESGAMALLHAEEGDHDVTSEDGRCGCRCGRHRAPGADSPLHNFKPGKCLCECGAARNPDASQHSYQSGRCVCDCGGTHRGVARAGCPGVCASCPRATDDADGRTETPAPESAHTPNGGGCGCRCGAFSASAAAANGPLHVQDPSACGCRCGRAPKGAGDHRRASSSVCKCYCGETEPAGHVLRARSCYCQCGETATHRYAASGTSGCNTCYCGAHTAHSPSESACSCRCGRTFVAHRFREGACLCYCGAERSHKYAAGACRCYCGDLHKPDYRKPECPNVCGKCGMLVADPTRAAGYLDHTPKRVGCGCACGAYGGSAYDPERHPGYHGGAGSPSCLCQCGATHANYSQSTCPLVCAVCRMNRARTKSGPEIHSWDDASCTCNCGTCTDHRYAPDGCSCYCGTRFRGHDQKATSDAVTGTYTCAACGNEIEKHRAHYVCNRCGHEEDADYESGHAWNCGTGSNDRPYGQHCNGCGCDNCSCQACQDQSGTCTSCGNSCGEDRPTEGGGESGGDGGLDDI